MPLAQSADRLLPYVLSFVRIMTALLLLQHGLSKFFGFPMAMKAPALFSLYWFAGVIELVISDACPMALVIPAHMQGTNAVLTAETTAVFMSMAAACCQ